MSTPLAEYLSALEARDSREQAHAEYIQAYTKLADRAPALANQPTSTDETAQLRTELASTQRSRGALETQVSTLTAELSSLQATSTAQRQRIEHLEKVKTALERRGKDRADELKGKGRFVEAVQDEMVALNLQLNIAEQDRDRLKKENEDLTRRWVQKMDEEARKMNDRMGWEEHGRGTGTGRRKGSAS